VINVVRLSDTLSLLGYRMSHHSPKGQNEMIEDQTAIASTRCERFRRISLSSLHRMICSMIIHSILSFIVPLLKHRCRFSFYFEEMQSRACCRRIKVSLPASVDLLRILSSRTTKRRRTIRRSERVARFGTITPFRFSKPACVCMCERTRLRSAIKYC